jgi:hypothetical protein
MMKSKTTEGVVLAASLIALSLGLAWAGRAGIIGPDMPTRISMGVYGLFIAYYGNAIPKVLLRSERAIMARRFAGWAFVLSGLATTAIWIAMPASFAVDASMVLIGSTVLLVAAICLLSRTSKA